MPIFIGHAFSSDGRITSLPSSVGNCCSLIEVGVFYPWKVQYQVMLESSKIMQASFNINWFCYICCWIKQIDLSCNLLAELPETLGDICNLKVLLFAVCVKAFMRVLNDGNFYKQIVVWEKFYEIFFFASHFFRWGSFKAPWSAVCEIMYGCEYAPCEGH